MLIYSENETPETLGQIFVGMLLSEISQQANDPRYSIAIKAMIVSVGFSAESIFLAVFEKELDIDQALKILDKIKDRFKSFVVEKFV